MHETEAVMQAKNGDKEAFIFLMEHYKQIMYQTARAILHNDTDAADAMQETILSCYQNLHQLNHAEYFKTWIIRILINQCNALIRQNQKIFPLEKVPESGYQENADEQILIHEILDSMEEIYRLVMVLYYVDGFAVREIAEILDLNENTVKTRLSRGREQFKKQYLTEEDEGGYTCG